MSAILLALYINVYKLEIKNPNKILYLYKVPPAKIDEGLYVELPGHREESEHCVCMRTSLEQSLPRQTDVARTVPQFNIWQKERNSRTRVKHEGHRSQV